MKYRIFLIQLIYLLTVCTSSKMHGITHSRSLSQGRTKSTKKILYHKAEPSSSKNKGQKRFKTKYSDKSSIKIAPRFLNLENKIRKHILARNNRDKEVNSTLNNFNFPSIGNMIEKDLNPEVFVKNNKTNGNNDYTDIESLKSFKNTKFKFDNYNLSQKQERWHNKINKSFKNSLKTDLFREDYGFRRFKNKSRRSTSNTQAKPPSRKSNIKNTIKSSKTDLNKKKARKLNHPYRRRSVSTTDLSDLNTFINNKDKSTIENNSTKNANIAGTEHQNTSTFDYTLNNMGKIDGTPYNWFEKSNNKKSALFGVEERNKIIRKLKLKTKNTSPKIQPRVEQADQTDTPLELYNPSDIDQAANNIENNDQKRIEGN